MTIQPRSTKPAIGGSVNQRAPKCPLGATRSEPMASPSRLTYAELGSRSFAKTAQSEGSQRIVLEPEEDQHDEV